MKTLWQSILSATDGTMNLLRTLYYTYSEHSIDRAIKVVESDLARLQPLVLNGNEKAAQTAWTKLEGLDCLRRQKEKERKQLNHK